MAYRFVRDSAAYPMYIFSFSFPFINGRPLARENHYRRVELGSHEVYGLAAQFVRPHNFAGHLPPVEIAQTVDHKINIVGFVLRFFQTRAEEQDFLDPVAFRNRFYIFNALGSQGHLRLLCFLFFNYSAL
jgi:hypothetical protein